MALRIGDIRNISELRIRLNSKLVAYYRMKRPEIIDYTVTREDIEHIIMTASNNSLYTVNDMLIKGFLVYDGGIRIGVTGDGVTESDNIIALKHINYLTVRVPREIDVDISGVPTPEQPLNTIIISPPGAGKTTLLRALTKYYSNKGNNVLLIDERYELAAAKNGMPALNVGVNTDVMSGVPKRKAYEIGIRTMRPDIISTDELYIKEEADALIEAAHCGIKVFVTAHAKDKEDFNNRKDVSAVMGIIEQVITLTDMPEAGTVRDVEVLRC
jgi:stage III sporulation protein AA